MTAQRRALRPGSTLPTARPFPLHNLPFGIGRRSDGSVGAFTAVGDHALDLAEAVGAGLLDGATTGLLDTDGTLNGFAAAGRSAHRAMRERLDSSCSPTVATEAQLAPWLVPLDELTMQLPVAVGDYVDFYSSIHHATNLGRMFRPDGEPLLPNWRHLPVGYHGRSGTIVADGVEIGRPSGVRLVHDAPCFGPSEALDIELEVGAVIGAPSRHGEQVSTADAEQHLFGLCWSTTGRRGDIQAFEYQPLGPFLGKSFATTMSPWVVTLDALEPFLVDPPAQHPPVADHLRTTGADRLRPLPRDRTPRAR